MQVLLKGAARCHGADKEEEPDEEEYEDDEEENPGAVQQSLAPTLIRRSVESAYAEYNATLDQRAKGLANRSPVVLLTEDASFVEEVVNCNVEDAEVICYADFSREGKVLKLRVEATFDYVDEDGEVEESVTRNINKEAVIRTWESLLEFINDVIKEAEEEKEFDDIEFFDV